MPKKEFFSKSLKNDDTIAKNVQIIHDIKNLESCITFKLETWHNIGKLLMKMFFHVWLDYVFQELWGSKILIIEGANFKIGALGILRIQHSNVILMVRTSKVHYEHKMSSSWAWWAMVDSQWVSNSISSSNRFSMLAITNISDIQNNLHIISIP